MRSTVPVSDGGKVTIPKVIRERLGIQSGDVVEIKVRTVEGEGNIEKD